MSVVITPEFRKFFQLEKYDEFQGIAIGVAAAEELDHDNEILDYEGSKPYFQAWSASQMKASGGKSKGNVRLQHDDKRPVGILTAIDYDDTNKMVRVASQIVDPVAKQMLAAGVLTGFSIGGDYIKRTPMPNGAVRYIAGPSEVSVCDRPCAPSALFSVVKGNGQTEMRKFAPRVEKDFSDSARAEAHQASARSHYASANEEQAKGNPEAAAAHIKAAEAHQNANSAQRFNTKWKDSASSRAEHLSQVADKISRGKAQGNTMRELDPFGMRKSAGVERPTFSGSKIVRR